MRLLLPSCLLVIPLLAGCENPCQRACHNLAEYGESCGAPYTERELNDCIEAFSDAEDHDLKTCRTYTSPDILRREWTCDDVVLFRQRLGDGREEGDEGEDSDID